MTTSSDLMEMLRASMNAPSRPSPGYLVGEIEAPDSLRRADALFLPLGHERRGQIHGYEFKISRADLRTELLDPMKADPWLRYCNTWTLFVSNAEIINGFEIPESWGIVAPPARPRSRALTVIRPAAKLTPIDQTRAFGKIIARLYYGGDGYTDERVKSMHERLESYEQQTIELARRATDAERRLATADPSQRNPNRELIDEIVAGVARAWTPDYRRTIERYTSERLIEMLSDVAALEGLRDRLAEQAERDLQDLETVHQERGRRLQQARKTLEQTKRQKGTR